MEKVRFGLIGIGAQGGAYAGFLTGQGGFPGMPAPQCPPHCALGALCDIDPEKEKMCREKYPDVPFFKDWKEMVASGTVDAVITTVPHYLHHEIAIYCLEHGMNVLVEKPAGVRAKDVMAMNKCAEEHPDVAFGIMFNQRTNKLYQKIKEIVASGELGEIRRSNWIINTWWRPDSYYQQSEWRATWGGEGGGVLVNQAPHQLDLWQWICGIPTKVTSKNINGSHRKIDVENDVTIVTEYANGATGSFITCTHDAIGTDRLEIDLDGGKIVVEDSKKAKIYRMKKTEPEMNETMSMMDVAKLTMGNAAGGLYDLEEFENQDGWGYQHTTVMENFACHIIEGTPLLAPGSDGINGVNLAEYTNASVRRAISYVPQNIELFSKTIYDNIRVSRMDATLDEVKEAAKKADAHDFIRHLPLQYNTYLEEAGNGLSGGEKQRIALARAFLKNSNLYILDESTSNLDFATENLIFNMIYNELADRSMLIVAHRLSTVRDCDLILVMDHGKIVERGTHDELLAKEGKYYELWNMQQGIFRKKAEAPKPVAAAVVEEDDDGESMTY